MSFLYPAFLLGALAVALPILLHLLRRDVAPEVPFTAVKLLRRSPLEQTRRRSLRDWLLLAARVAALLLLAAAFGRPYLQGAGGGSLRVVAVDRSYSMAAPGVFERALALARDSVDAAGAGEQVAVMAFDDRAELIAPPGGRAEAHTGLSAIAPGFGGTRYAAAIGSTIEMAAGADARLIVVTDMQRAGWADEEPQTVPGTLRIEVLDAGARAGNTAVTHARRAEDGVVAGIRNHNPHPAAGTARLLVDGVAAASTPFNVPSGGTMDVPLVHRLPERGSAVVQIDDAGGYPADDSRYLVLDPRSRTRVLVAGSDAAEPAFYLTRALMAADADERLDVRPIAAGGLGRIPAGEMSGTGAVLLLSTRNLDHRGRDLLARFVRTGGGLFVAAGTDVDPAVLATAMGWDDFSATERPAGVATLAATDLRHPIFRPFSALAANLGQVRFTRAWRLPEEGWDVASRFTDGTPALLERRHGAGRVMVFASDLERRWNDFPLHPAFVPFTMEIVRYISAHAGTPREYLVPEGPSASERTPGVFSLEGTDTRVAVNVDLRESAPARMTADDFLAMVHPAESGAPPRERLQARQLEARQNLWRYGLLLMLGVLVAESFAGRR